MVLGSAVQALVAENARLKRPIQQLGWELSTRHTPEVEAPPSFAGPAARVLTDERG